MFVTHDFVVWRFWGWIFIIYIYILQTEIVVPIELPVPVSHNSDVDAACRGLFLGVSFIRTDQECSRGSRFLSQRYLFHIAGSIISNTCSISTAKQIYFPPRNEPT